MRQFDDILCRDGRLSEEDALGSQIVEDAKHGRGLERGLTQARK
jgi:hypothetical protein